MAKSNPKFEDSSSLIIRSFYDAYNKFGFGFNKSVYVNAFALFLKQHNLTVQKDKEITIKLFTDSIGQFKIDFLIDDRILVHITTDEQIQDKEILRLFNFVRSSKHSIGLILNFGLKPEHKRREAE